MNKIAVQDMGLIRYIAGQIGKTVGQRMALTRVAGIQKISLNQKLFVLCHKLFVLYPGGARKSALELLLAPENITLPAINREGVTSAMVDRWCIELELATAAAGDCPYQTLSDIAEQSLLVFFNGAAALEVYLDKYDECAAAIAALEAQARELELANQTIANLEAKVRELEESKK